jgi:general secretion pathway protein G
MDRGMRRRKGSGFTLVELLVVIVLISVLAAIAIPKLGTQWQSSSERRMLAQLKLLREAAARFESDTGCFPRSTADLTSGTAPSQCWTATGAVIPVPTGKWRGPYLNNRGYAASNVHPRVRSISLTYTQPTASAPYNIKYNSSQTTLGGENVGSW